MDIAHGQRPPLQKRTTTLIITDEEMEDIIKIVKSLEDSSLSIKDATKIINNSTKEKKVDF